jgi:hypothetical protein
MKPIINHLDGWLYVGIAVCAACIDIFGTDAAKGLIPAGALFFSLSFFKVFQAALLAGKMYRSTTFKSKQEQDGAAPTPPQLPGDPPKP